MRHGFGAWLDNFPDALIPGHIALDVGCGSGDDTLVLLNAGLRVVALDLNPDNIHTAATRAPAASFLVADLRASLPFREGAFNLAVASLSLHYFDRRATDSILRDLRRVTTPGATLLARVNVVGDHLSRWGVGIEREKDFFEVQPGELKRFFTEDTLRETVDPSFAVNRLFLTTTLVQEQHPKQTLVVRATRRDP